MSVLDRRVDAVFSVSSLALLLLAALVVFLELQPPYRAHQDRAYEALAVAAEAEGNQDLAAYYRGPEAERGIRQIFLATGEVERCLTCHVDDAGLDAWHLESVNDRLPPTIYGCTACHGGEPLGLMVEKHYDPADEHAHRAGAHRHLMATVAEMEAPLFSASVSNATYISDFWARLQEISPPLSNPVAARQPDYRDVHVTGQPMGFLGSGTCLGCHSPEVALAEHTYSERTWWHVDRWRATKFNSFDIISREPDYQNPPADILSARGIGADDYRANCQGCHTTGSRRTPDGAAIVDTFKEPGVTCEGCHGPGQAYGGLMLRAKEETVQGIHSFQGEGALIARIHTDRNTCLACHNPNRHELRPQEGERGELARLAARRYAVMAGLEPLPLLEPAEPADDGGEETDPLVAAGRDLAAAKGCTACHSTDGTSIIGPTWLGLFGSERTMGDGTTATADEAYLEESIRDPNLRLVEGFFGVMPATFADLPDEEMAALIAYIKSLG